MSETTKAVKTDKQAYLQEILNDIERKKLEHKRTLFRINDRITDDVAKYIQEYFKGDPRYSLQMEKCKKCKNEWDVIIIFL